MLLFPRSFFFLALSLQLPPNASEGVPPLFLSLSFSYLPAAIHCLFACLFVCLFVLFVFVLCALCAFVCLCACLPLRSLLDVWMIWDGFDTRKRWGTTYHIYISLLCSSLSSSLSNPISLFVMLALHVHLFF